MRKSTPGILLFGIVLLCLLGEITGQKIGMWRERSSYISNCAIVDSRGGLGRRDNLWETVTFSSRTARVSNPLRVCRF